MHRYDGTPRQDDFALMIRRDTGQLIVAVADGVSSAKQSHIGSTTAVRYALQWLNATSDQADQIDWNGLVRSTAWALVEQACALFALDENSAEQAEQLIATTLVCALVTPKGDGTATATIVSIGDSGAWILSEGKFDRVQGGKDASEAGVSSSAVSGLPRLPSSVEPITRTIQAHETLLLGTDGFGDPLGSGDGAVGQLFASVLTNQIPSLLEFVHALDFSRETFDDDRTLVAIWPRAVNASAR
jgi:serine/threonine protein phosphatase PrpC